MNTVDLQALLDQKCNESSLALEKERKRDLTACNIEIAVVVSFISIFTFLAYYICWGAGYSVLASQQYEQSVATLKAMPGPQGQLIEAAIAENGYISLIEYNNYVEMANEFKVLDSAPESNLLEGDVGSDESVDSSNTEADVLNENSESQPVDAENKTTDSAADQ